MRILIVEDNEDARIILKTILRSNGCDVVEAADGKEALEETIRMPPDMIISDILMPVMDGFQLCRKIKRDENLRKIPFIFYTATYVDEKDEEFGMKIGAEGFIRKPMEADEFIHMIQGFVEEKERGVFESREPLFEEEEETFKLYSERLIKKLEKKMLELEEEIKQRKQMEASLKESEERLRQAHKMEAIGTLAGGIAHEFNNILGIILGNAELAMDDVPDWNPAKESLREIRSASLRAKDVVRQILSFARKTMTDLQPVEITTIIRESLKLMRATIPTMIEIRSNFPSEPQMILGHPTEVHQIFMNLCGNAAYSMKEKGGILEIDVSLVSLDKHSVAPYEDMAPGDFVKLTVKDSGHGIAPEIMKSIFDPYFTTKDVGEGSGMGLAVVYGLVKKCNAAIRVKSEVGKETVVEVLFPRIEEAVPQTAQKKEGLPTGNERILLVDDEESMVRMVRQILERLGYQVVGMTDSVAALERFRSNPQDFDLVITDMAMPHMAGDEFAAGLLEIRRDIPILLCTGHSDGMDEERAKRIGIAGFATKPVEKRELAGVVRGLLEPRPEIKRPLWQG